MILNKKIQLIHITEYDIDQTVSEYTSKEYCATVRALRQKEFLIKNTQFDNEKKYLAVFVMCDLSGINVKEHIIKIESENYRIVKIEPVLVFNYTNIYIESSNEWDI